MNSVFIRSLYFSVLAMSFFTPILARSAPALPTSYDMMNGGEATFTYFDDSYTGAGDNSVPYASLSGGLGDLTNGIVATQHWDDTPGIYVGWQNRDVDITFQFLTSLVFDSFRVSFDDENGFSGVVPPTSVTVNGMVFSINDPAAGEPFTEIFDISGLHTDSLVMHFQTGGEWLMISEIQFEAVPEPSCFAIVLVGIGISSFTSACRNRRQRP